MWLVRRRSGTGREGSERIRMWWPLPLLLPLLLLDTTPAFWTSTRWPRCALRLRESESLSLRSLIRPRRLGVFDSSLWICATSVRRCLLVLL
ncbi:hypothetical protein IWX47DRAFT_852942 [Phyllosticta citricarpa]